LAPPPWDVARATMSTEPTPRSSALPFDAAPKMMARP
jgi:hypothetical protein